MDNLNKNIDDLKKLRNEINDKVEKRELNKHIRKVLELLVSRRQFDQTVGEILRGVADFQKVGRTVLGPGKDRRNSFIIVTVRKNRKDARDRS